jgi:hypothetical protein
MKMWPDIGGGMIPADPKHHMLIAGTLLLIAGTKHHMPYGIATYLVDVHLSTSESQSIKCDKGFVVAIVDKHPNTARQLGGERKLVFTVAGMYRSLIDRPCACRFVYESTPTHPAYVL